MKQIIPKPQAAPKYKLKEVQFWWICKNNYLLTGKKVSLFYRNELEVERSETNNVREFIEVTKVTRFTG